MDTRRFLLAIVLAVAVLLVWQRLFPPPVAERPLATEGEDAAPAAGVGQEAPPPAGPTPPEEAPAEPPAETATRAAADLAGDAGVSGAAEPVPEVSAEREERVVVETATYRAELTNRGGQLVSFELREHLRASGGPVDLVRARDEGPYPFGLVEPGGESSALNEALFTVARSRQGSHQRVDFRYSGPAGRAAKSFVFGDEGLFEVEVELPEGRGRSVVLGPGLRNPTAEESDNRFARRSAIYRTVEDKEQVDPAGANEVTVIDGRRLRWVGLQDNYFLTALVLDGAAEEVRLEPMLAAHSADEGISHFRPLPPELGEEDKETPKELRVLVRPREGRLEAVAYWGPKIFDRLAAQPYGLEETVALGPFGFISRPLLYGLRWIHDNVVGNYGWAIILMTVLIRLLLFPLTHKSVVSMQKMQELNPKIQAIRQKYRSKLKDKQGRPNAEAQRKMNEEIMALYKSEGVNPAGGCLPMLLQIPVLFAFYSLLSTAIELRGAPWVLWIQDLSVADPYLALPIVMGGTQFVQQRLTPSAADPMQRRIFMLMPVFFTVLFLGFPSGLVLYWLTNNVLGIAQQLVYNRLKERKARVQEERPDDKTKRKDAE